MTIFQDTQGPERFLTIPTAAKASGLKYHLLLRAVNKELIPSYRPLNGRRMVLLSDIRAFVLKHKSANPPGYTADDPVEHLSPPDQVVRAHANSRDGGVS